MNEKYTYTFNANILTDIDNIPEDSIISKTIHNNDIVKVLIFGFAKGQELSEHTASVPAILHLLEGKAELTLGGTITEASPGAWIYLSPKLPHSIYAKTSLKMLLYLLKSGSESE